MLNSNGALGRVQGFIQGLDAASKYAMGDRSTYTEKDLLPGAVPYFQEMAQRAYEKHPSLSGQTLYGDHRNLGQNLMSGNPALSVIGRTAPGNITRDGNDWVIKDTYDFGNKGSVRKSLSEGRIGSAIAQSFEKLPDSSYEVNMRIPMTPEQKAFYNSPKAQDISGMTSDTFTMGGQKYKWVEQEVKGNESVSSLAQDAFADNTYKPEGSNLAKYQRAITAKNPDVIGKPGDRMMVPVSISPKEASKTDKALMLLGDHIDRIMGR